MANYTLKQFKSVLNIRKAPDSWFWEKYGLNPYHGCEHGCIYCDSRSAKYRLPTDFENEIVVKENVAQMLTTRILKSRSVLPDVVCMAGATDPYHAAEAKYETTKSVLDVLKKYQFPVHILTKSALVLRDLDLLKSIAQQTWSCVSVTITTTDKETARFIEPHAPNPDVRFKIIETLKKDAPNIQSGVLLMPVIPFISDAPWQLEDLVKKAKEHGADYILFGGSMTMRDAQALWFLKHLKENFPVLIPKYEDLYNFSYNPEVYQGNYGPSPEYNMGVSKTILELCQKYNMPYRIKRFIPNDFRKLNYITAEKLLNKAYEKSLSNQSDKHLFGAGMEIQQLKVSVQSLYQQNGLKEIKYLNTEVEAIIKSTIREIIGEVEQHRQMGLFD